MHNTFDIYLFILSETKAYRNTESGSWFLNAIVWTFKYHAYKEDILQLLGRVGLNDFFLSNISDLLKKVFKFQLTEDM